MFAARARTALRGARGLATAARVSVLDKLFAHPRHASAVMHQPSKAAPNAQQKFTYGQLQEKVVAFSSHVAARPGASTRPIASFLPSSVEYCATMLGTWHRNCAFVPLSTQHTPEELSYFLSDTSPQCVVTNAAYEATIAPIAKKLDIPVVHVEDAIAAAAHQGARQIPPTSANDAALVVYTSGTTGNQSNLASTCCVLLARAEAVGCRVDRSTKGSRAHAQDGRPHDPELD